MSLTLERRINAFCKLGEAFSDYAQILEAESSRNDHSIASIQKRAEIENPWFTSDNLRYALGAWAILLNEESLSNWLKDYEIESGSNKVMKVGVVNAGNIPMVAFHDFLSVLLSGHVYIGRNASVDKVLIPFISSVLISIEPEFSHRIQFTDRLTDFDAVIATGSNNSSRYFEYYFSKYPHIIRKNRNGVAVLDGTESKEDLAILGDDIFKYFGLGCRSISKIFVPSGYTFDPLFEALYPFNNLMQHSKYMNNFDHHNAVLLLKQIPFLTNGFIIVREEKTIASPVAILNYECYTSTEWLEEELIRNKEHLQCIASNSNVLRKNPELKNLVTDLGKTQSPNLNEYADGVDTMRFLISLGSKKQSTEITGSSHG